MLKLRIGGVNEHYNLPWHLANESGRFEALGLDLQWMDCSGGTGQMTQLLDDGGLDMAVLLTEGIVAAILQGSDAKILKVFVQSPLEWGVHMLKGKTIPFSHEPLRVAVSRLGSGSHLMGLQYIQSQYSPPPALDFKVVGTLQGAIAAFKANEVDLFLWERYTTEPHCAPHGLQRVDSLFTPWPCFVIAVRPEYYDAHPSIIDTMLDEVFKQAAILKNSPQAVADIASRYQLLPERVAHWFAQVVWGSGEALSTSQIQRVIQDLQASGGVAGAGTMDEHLERFT